MAIGGAFYELYKIVAWNVGYAGEMTKSRRTQRYNGCMLHGGFTEMESDSL